MNSWIYFVLIAELMWAFTSLFDKILLSKNYIKSPLIFIVFNGLMNVLVFFLFPFFNFELLGKIDILISILAGVFLTAGIMLYYKAVQHEEISRVLMLWQLVPIFVLVFSFLFLREVLTAGSFIGFFFLLIAGLVVSYKKSKDSFRIGRAFYYMVASTFFISIFYIFSKHIYKAASFWNAFMWLRLSALAPVLLLLVPSVRTRFLSDFKDMKSGAKRLILSKMTIDFSAFIVLGFAMLSGPVSLISALGSSTAPVFIFAITLVTSLHFPKIVKEDINSKSVLIKISAIILIIAGIWFINL